MLVLNNISQLTMSSKFDVIAGEKGNIALYLHELMNRNINSKDVYVNFTDVCALYNKAPAEYLRLDSTKEYHKKIAKMRGITIPIVKTIKGRYGGSYLHYAGLLNALRWVNIDIAIELDYILEQVFRQADTVKIHREECKTHFFPLTNAIKENILPHINNKMGRKMIYATFMDFANMQVMGLTARQFRDLKAKEGELIHKDETRCHFGDDNLDKIIEVEKQLYNLIVTMELESFHQVKALYLKRIKPRFIWNYTYDELKVFNNKVDILEARIAKQEKEGRKTERSLNTLKELLAKYNQ